MSENLKVHKPTTPGLRHRVTLKTGDSNPARRQRGLWFRLKKAAGRSRGKVTVRHKGGGAIKFYRQIDFKRDKIGVPGRVAAIEYDPNRNAPLAKINYVDGEKRYILRPSGLALSATVMSGPLSPLTIGNALPLAKIPSGTAVHNLEINPGAGGKMVRGAGVAAYVLAPDEDRRYIRVKMPSGEIRRFLGDCLATIGQVGNIAFRNLRRGKAGRTRHLGIRPRVRGVAQNPKSHPHGGGEGRSGIGMPHPKTPWGKIALGGKTRRREHTDRYIISRERR